MDSIVAPKVGRSDVKKSLETLNSILNSPSRPRPGPRASQLTTNAPFQQSYSPMVGTSGLSFGRSNAFGLFTPDRAPSETPSTKAVFGSTMLGLADRASFIEQTVGQDVTTNMTLLLEDDAELSACRSIFSDFAGSVKLGQQDLFEPIHRYESICRKTVAPLQKIANEGLPAQNKLSRTLGMLNMLLHEMDTWSLVSSLYQDRFSALNQFQDEAMSVDSYRPSEKRLTDDLFELDQTLRQAQLVVDWLEHTAERYLDEFYNKVEFSIDQKGAWENTLHLLKEKHAGIQTGSQKHIVTEMDPDAPLRQGKHLVDLDKDDDTLLQKHIFICIRAGRLDEATKVCSKVGQLWRAATLEGWRLHHDPNMEQLGPGGRLESVEGNPFRDLWKRTCWKIAEDDRLSVDERGIYAALSGNLKHLLPCCHSWEDYVWAYFRVLVDQIVENNIHKSFIGPRPLLDLPNFYTDRSLTFEGVFAEIDACSTEKIQKEASKRFSLIQKHIILGDVDGLIDDMHMWCTEEREKCNPHLIRVMAHLVLFFRSLDFSTKEALCDAILEEYIEVLIRDKHVDLVAMYVSRVPKPLQIQLYSKFLEGIVGTEERRRCLFLAEEEGLDVPIITKQVVENIRNTDADDFRTDVDFQLEATTSDDDRRKIGAIEWLTFDTEQRSETLRQVNAIMRSFLGARKLAACHEATGAVPNDSIAVIVRAWQKKGGNEALPAADDNAIREHLCIKAYLDAQDSFSRWFEHYHHAKPIKPESAIGGNFTERVAIEHKLREYEAELDSWQHSLMRQTEVTKKKIYNVLLFPNGGWMVDQRPEDEVDEIRLHQMSLLRQLCLPTLCFLLHKVLHTTEQYKECLQMADIIASEDLQLYKVFQPEELQKLLHRLQESSVALLDSGLDPLGYQLS